MPVPNRLITTFTKEMEKSDNCQIWQNIVTQVNIKLHQAFKFDNIAKLALAVDASFLHPPPPLMKEVQFEI
jgi:hypothetical protein